MSVLLIAITAVIGVYLKGYLQRGACTVLVAWFIDVSIGVFTVWVIILTLSVEMYTVDLLFCNKLQK